MAVFLSDTVQLIYYSRKYDEGYYPETKTIKIWNNWYDEHKYRLEKLRINPHY